MEAILKTLAPFTWERELSFYHRTMDPKFPTHSAFDKLCCYTMPSAATVKVFPPDRPKYYRCRDFFFSIYGLVWWFFFHSFNLPVSRLMETRRCTVLYLIINHRCAFLVTTSVGKSVLSVRLIKLNEWNFQRLNTQLDSHRPNLCHLHQVPALFFLLCLPFWQYYKVFEGRAGTGAVSTISGGGKHSTLFTFILRLMKTCTL